MKIPKIPKNARVDPPSGAVGRGRGGTDRGVELEVGNGAIPYEE